VGAAANLYEKDSKSLRPRARQNVILELGYFIGKLGRKRVSVTFREGVEQPSDILGMLYIRYGDDRSWQIELAQELRAAGVEIDLNKLIAP
jgi:predicted nucleotide-binding protein